MELISNTIDSCQSNDASTHATNVKHQYGTRIRQNSVIKPSARLRQSPELPTPLRRIKPVPTPKVAPALPDFPPFPPPHIVLHPDDANSKVFLAIGRAFLSVDNRAMTIKDLAEMTLKFGLVCQNVSAAGQAITTYIRNHMVRCDSEGDHPLLLRHILSGTLSDDDLLPALFSRSGGAHCTANAEDRATNFRRGTMVWYLSRATGAPCPFGRAGISLREYGERTKSGSYAVVKDKREDEPFPRQEKCGQKRKRISRRCVGRSSDTESSEAECKRPPKVKLTLRLCPSMSHSAPTPTSSPPRSTSLPAHKTSDSSSSDSDSSSDPDSEDSDSLLSDDENEDISHWPEPVLSQPPPTFTPLFTSRLNPPISCLSSPQPQVMAEYYPRSPSIAYSFASPPPESEADDDYIHMSDGTDDWDVAFDGSDDLDADAETQWESPGPRSPSAPIMSIFPADIIVKQEDTQDMLNPWDTLDNLVTDPKVVEVVARAAAGLYKPGIQGSSEIKTESSDFWFPDGPFRSITPDWFARPISVEPEIGIHVKEEEIEPHPPLTSLFDRDASSPLSPYSSVSSHASTFPAAASPSPDLLYMRRHSESVWRDAELLGPEHINPREFDEWHTPSHSGTVRARAKTFPVLPSLAASAAVPIWESAPSDATSLASEPLYLWTPPDTPESYAQSPEVPQTVSPDCLVVSEEARSVTDSGSTDVVVVHTCQLCNPAISATQVEGISVYQMVLGCSPVFRRIDTDFVNLTPIINYLGVPCPPLSTIPNATVVANSSPNVTGVWVPLMTAQSFIQNYPLPEGLLDIFLSDTLFELFPPALQDFHLSNTSARLLNHFGPHFKSTLDQRRSSQLTIRTDSLLPERSGEREPVSEWEMEDHPTHSSYPTSMNPLVEPTMELVHTPLSSTEQEIFQSLCADLDWDKDVVEVRVHSTTPAPPSEEDVTRTEEEAVQETKTPVVTVADRRSLRRSKRVANAIAASHTAPSTRSRRQSSRSSSS